MERRETGRAAVQVVIEQERMGMKKTISLFHCVSILFSVTGHVSVFIAPSAVLSYTGSVALSLIMWTIGGLLNLCLALSFTELATMFPKSGGAYAYILEVFGPFVGFVIAWGYMALIIAPQWAFCAYSSSVYILKAFFISCSPPKAGVVLLAMWILGIFVGCFKVSFLCPRIK